MKPHIWKGTDAWLCASGNQVDIVAGKTPLSAYLKWQRFTHLASCNPMKLGGLSSSMAETIAEALSRKGMR